GVYGSIIGSNIGAFLTPVGALAGIMWTSILKKHEIKYTFLDFVKYGIIISVPTILASLFILDIVLK
ncbi:MAG: ArsB/NhaD family transporter, partial [Clostridia bacterium]